MSEILSRSLKKPCLNSCEIVATTNDDLPIKLSFCRATKHNSALVESIHLYMLTKSEGTNPFMCFLDKAQKIKLIHVEPY